MSEPLPAYEGDQHYIYVSYSRRDEAVVYDEIRALRGEGARQLAEITVESQTKAFDVIRQRIEANMQNLFNRSNDD